MAPGQGAGEALIAGRELGCPAWTDGLHLGQDKEPLITGELGPASEIGGRETHSLSTETRPSPPLGMESGSWALGFRTSLPGGPESVVLPAPCGVTAPHPLSSSGSSEGEDPRFRERL